MISLLFVFLSCVIQYSSIHIPISALCKAQQTPHLSSKVFNQFLHYKTKQQGKILQLKLGNLMQLALYGRAHKKQFLFSTMNYAHFIKYTLINNGLKFAVSFSQLTATNPRFQKITVICLPETATKFAIGSKLLIGLGEQTVQLALRCKMQNLRIVAHKNELKAGAKTVTLKPIIDNNYLPWHGAFNPKCMQFMATATFEKAINKLPNYIAVGRPPNLQRQQLYLCHDMKGGYTQQINFTEPSCAQHDFGYRSLIMWQTGIFNYFSHESVTIPPMHWIIVCRRYGAKCLGTFIIQKQSISEENYLTTEFINLLVYACRYYRFDGYLINIESPVMKHKVLQKWLRDLTSKLHLYVPNSIITWYDSVSNVNGKVLYQNEVNEHNIPYIQECDHYFTNYWWTENHLAKSITNHQRIKNKNVYVGNDCFGRGTFKGGKMNIHQAASAIRQANQQKKGELGISLFAPCYTYECQSGNKDPFTFMLNQQKMYRGITSATFDLVKSLTLTKNGGQGWQQQADWFVSSHQWCRKEFRVNASNLKGCKDTIKVVARVRVAGTGPNFVDPYKIILQIYNLKLNQIIRASDDDNTVNLKWSQKDEKIVQEQLRIDSQTLLDCEFRVILYGKDSEGWAGHYGARFADPKLILTFYRNTDDWMAHIPVCPIDTQQTYNSFCNLGFGPHFYYDGQPKQDLDIPQIHSLNNPLDYEFVLNDSYIGGSSIKITTKTAKILYVSGKLTPSKTMLFLRTDQCCQISVSIFSKETSIKLIEKNGNLALQAGKWKMRQYNLPETIQETEMQGWIQVTAESYPYLLGQILMGEANDELQVEKETSYIQMSSLNSMGSSLFFNLQIFFQKELPLYRRLLVCIGSNFACFGYIIDRRLQLNNIEIKKSNQEVLRLVLRDVEKANAKIVYERDFTMEKIFEQCRVHLQ